MNKRLSKCIKYINVILAIFIVFLHSKNYVYYENNSELINITVKIEDFLQNIFFHVRFHFCFLYLDICFIRI